MLKIAYHPIYKHPLPEGHRFPMEKYELLPQQLIHEGTCTQTNFFEPSKPNDKHILAVHEPEYYYDLVNITLNQRAARKIGFPLSEVLVEREVPDRWCPVAMRRLVLAHQHEGFISLPLLKPLE